MLCMYILSVLLFISYVISIIIINKSIPIHLSESFFILKHKYIFSAVMILLCFLTVMPLIEVLPMNLAFIAFLMCGSIAFIGVTPNYSDSFEGKIHKISAIIAIVLSQLLIALTEPIILLSWLLLSLIFYLCCKVFGKKASDLKLLFWVEILAFVNTYILIVIRMVGI